jgi:hypothetical protein
MWTWLRKLLVPCPECERIAREAGAPYSAAHRRYHRDHGT